MLSKSDLKRIAKERLADAETLFNAGRFDGATYLCGYVVEISLKLRICKTLRWNGFPETKKEFEGLSSFQIHDFDKLLHLSGVEERVKRSYLPEWSMVKTWSPESRYSRVVRRNRSEVIQRKREVSDILEATKLLMKLL